MGIGHVSIFFHQILPNALTPVITIMPFSLIGGITSLTALDFLGFGLPPPVPSWGELLSQGLNNLYAPWIAVSTVSALFITLLLATFIGEGFREAFDPKSEYRIE
jgi:microcin C transport system permease protein